MGGKRAFTARSAKESNPLHGDAGDQIVYQAEKFLGQHAPDAALSTSDGTEFKKVKTRCCSLAQVTPETSLDPPQ